MTLMVVRAGVAHELFLAPDPGFMNRLKRADIEQLAALVRQTLRLGE